jgi:hypothetical protein
MYLSLLKSLNRLHPRAWDFVQLTRIDKPIGIYLLLWPTLWAVWIASKGSPSLSTLLIFVVGVFLMRAAGCVINDFADRKVDGHVKRTEQRPLVSGRVTSKEALILFAVLVTLSFVLVLFTNATTIWLSFGGLALAATYPFMKRYTYYPQVVLGAAFSWGMPMAFTAETGELPAAAWLLYIANLLWTGVRHVLRDDGSRGRLENRCEIHRRAIRRRGSGDHPDAAMPGVVLPDAGRNTLRAGPVLLHRPAGRGGMLRLGVLVDARQRPASLLQGVSAQPLGGTGDFCRYRSGLRAALTDSGRRSAKVQIKAWRCAKRRLCRRRFCRQRPYRF